MSGPEATIQALPVPSLSVDTNTAPASGTQAAPSQTTGTLKGLDHWLKDFQEHEAVLAEMAVASADNKFKDDLGTMEQWFQGLSKPERTASVCSILQHSTEDQIPFFMAVLKQLTKPEDKNLPEAIDSATKPKSSKVGLRPPSLDIPLVPDSPVTPTPLTSRVDSVLDLGDGNRLNSVKGSQANNGATSGKGPGLSAINPATLNMLAHSGLSNEAQLLAVQLVMNGILQPADGFTSQNPPNSGFPKNKKASQASSWRTPSSAKFPGSAKYPTSALRSGFKSSGLKSSGLKSSGLDSASFESPRVEDFNPELLQDIPAWLRSLRLHKYTSCFDEMTWQEMVVLGDEALEQKGVTALGARRRLLRTFDHVRKEMGMEDPMSATPTTSLLPPTIYENVSAEAGSTPRSAVPTTKLSAHSPVFTPSAKVPHSAAASLAAPTEMAATTEIVVAATETAATTEIVVAATETAATAVASAA